MSKTDSVQRFWESFCAENPEISPDTTFQVWYFGNSREMALELGDLVLSGKKKATASLVSINEMKPEIAPVPDGYSVVTDFEGSPLCVIRTTEIRHLPFSQVDAQFAFDEGEDDRTLESWREGHWRYFTKEAAEENVEFDEKSLICCERFALLYP